MSNWCHDAHNAVTLKNAGNYDSGFGREPAKMKWDAKGAPYGTGSEESDEPSARSEDSAPVRRPSLFIYVFVRLLLKLMPPFPTGNEAALG
jgi:hypothetical protein